MQTCGRCHQGLSDRRVAPEQTIQTGFSESPYTQEREEARTLTVPPGPEQTSTAPYSSGPPSDRSGKPGSVVPVRRPSLPSKWATPPQCTRQSSQHRGPLSPAALVAVPAQSGHPGTGAASPGPIPGSRSAGPAANWSCYQIHCYSFPPRDPTSRGQLPAPNPTSHAPPLMLLWLLGGAAADDSSWQCLGISSQHEFLKVLQQVIIISSRPSPAGLEAWGWQEEVSGKA